MPAPGPADALYREAFERVVTKHGYDGEWVEVAEPEVAVAGVASGKFTFSAGVTATAMAAQEKQGADLVFVGDFLKQFWTVSGKTVLTQCGQLAGKKFGLNSPGGVSTALFKAWVAAKCPGTEAEVVYIDGSDNRVQGLLAGQLDASMIDINGTLAFDDKLHIIADLATDLPGISTNNIFANNTFAKANPKVVQDLLAELLTLSDEINKDPKVFSDAIKKWVPAFADQADAISALYVERGLVDATGGNQIDGMTKSLELFQSVEAVGPNLTIDKAVDRTYLDAALSAAGKA